ncbi:MAG: ribose 5-phosphate isomerase B [Candidatus Riflebacteria bacterium]|nr:ribose 5-phosphate isomerase B [Candidatus Riflebacteria bacterium]
MPKIFIGADHGGYQLKEELKKHLLSKGYVVEDVGTYSEASVDYPDFAYLVAKAVAQNPQVLGIVIDGAGIGSCMVANKVPGVRAACCNDLYTAKNSREHNHANLLTMGSMVVGKGYMIQIVDAWLNTDPAPGRHAKRVAKMMEFEHLALMQGVEGRG